MWIDILVILWKKKMFLKLTFCLSVKFDRIRREVMNNFANFLKYIWTYCVKWLNFYKMIYYPSQWNNLHKNQIWLRSSSISKIHCGRLPFSIKMRSSSIFKKIRLSSIFQTNEVVFHFPKKWRSSSIYVIIWLYTEIQPPGLLKL